MTSCTIPLFGSSLDYYYYCGFLAAEALLAYFGADGDGLDRL